MYFKEKKSTFAKIPLFKRRFPISIWLPEVPEPIERYPRNLPHCYTKALPRLRNSLSAAVPPVRKHTRVRFLGWAAAEKKKRHRATRNHRELPARGENEDGCPGGGFVGCCCAVCIYATGGRALQSNAAPLCDITTAAVSPPLFPALCVWLLVCYAAQFFRVIAESLAAALEAWRNNV